jgi:hypothetical protein
MCEGICSAWGADGAIFEWRAYGRFAQIASSQGFGGFGAGKLFDQAGGIANGFLRLGRLQRAGGERRRRRSFVRARLVDLLLRHIALADHGFETFTRRARQRVLFLCPLNLRGCRLGARCLRVHLTPGEIDVRLQRGYLGPSLLQPELERLRVDFRKHVASPYQLIVDDVDRHEAPTHLGRDACRIGE